MRVTLKILKNGEHVNSVTWENGVYRVGRSDFCDLPLEDENVSRSHLEIRVGDTGCYVTNMSSAGNLRINGELLETAELSDGDLIQLGTFELLMVFGDPAIQMASGQGEEEPQVENVVTGPSGTFRIDAISDGTVLPVEGTGALRAETLVEAKPIVAKILFTDGPKRGTELFLEAFEVTLGRSKKADVFIDDDKLSRIHAKITRVGMGYRIIDISSRNGTFVNGVRILEHPLASFDSIELGRSKIQFLIHDVVSADLAKGAAKLTLAETRSLQLVVNPESHRFPNAPSPPSKVFSPEFHKLPELHRKVSPIVLVVLVVGALVITWSLFSPRPQPNPVIQEETKPVPETKLPPSIPREFGELSSENQRAVEGYYNSAIAAAEQRRWEDALWNLKKLRELVPYYKQSIELADAYTRRFKEKQLEETQKKASQSEATDLARYLQEGNEYLKEGNWDLAADAFNQAITIDPTNNIAKLGLRAAEYKVPSIQELPPERDPEKEKKQAIIELFEKAKTALLNKSYQEAIDAGEKIRTIELKGDTRYLSDAKLIIDRARLLQKEEFEPFLLEAKGKFAEGDYNSSRDLCEEMVKRDPAYDEAKECLIRAKKQLNRLAKENYTTGYVLESMNRIEDAKQYWNRAKSFVRPGDPYYDKVMKKLDDHQ